MARDGISGGRGYAYETRICIYCFVSGYIKEKKDFCLEYQVKGAGKFDDVVFHENGSKYQLIQSKHKENDLRITHVQLFNENFNSTYGLLKYIKSFMDIDSNDKFKSKIKCAVVFTNIDIDLKDGRLDLTYNPSKKAKDWFIGVEKLKPTEVFLDDDAIMSFSPGNGNPKYYKVPGDRNFIQALMKQAKWFKNQYRKKKSQDNRISKLDFEFLSFLEKLTEGDLKYALEHIIYAVNQPNDKELEEIIKKQIEQKFAMTNANDIYRELEMNFREWCDRKTGIFPDIITYEDADKFFQKQMKVIKFNVSAPTDFFTGRKDKLVQIREELLKTGDLIVSQTIAISGLGGVGKTETTRQFIKEYGESDFYGRVIWISAENDETVEQSFKHLAGRLKLNEREYIKTIIDQTFEYFNGFKVLFVFDNYDKKVDENSENLVSYCRKCASGQKTSNRPYFLFTSRDKTCLPGVFSIDLGMLTQNEAIDLIEKHLKGDQNIDNIKALAKILNGFPLAMRQAIAYINEKFENVFEKGYELTNYLADFETKRSELLGAKYQDDYGITQKQTTMIIWNITLESIENYDEGAVCIKILKFLSYLYADEINLNIFITYFKNEQVISKAIKLLERYCLVTHRDNSKVQIHRLVQVVIQEKFIDVKNETLEQAIRLIFPKLFEIEAFQKITMASGISLKKYINLFFKTNEQYKKIIETFDFEQILHFNNVFCILKENFGAFETYEKLYEEVNSKNLLQIVFRDNIENILKLDDTILKLMVEKHFKEIIERNCINFVKLALEKGFFNDAHVYTENGMPIILKPTIRIEMFLLLFPKIKILEWPSDDTSLREFEGLEEFLTSARQTLNINESSLDGCTILHAICMYSKKDVHDAEYLVKNGINIDKKDKNGRTALYYAITSGHIEISKYLLGLSKDKCEESFKVAIEKDYLPLVQIFVDKYFERNYKFKDGKTPIDIAVSYVSSKTVFFLKSEFEELSKQKEKVNIKNENGETLLIKCIKDTKNDKIHLLLDYVKLFVENGVDIDAIDKDECSAVFYAMFNSFYDVFEYLLDSSASIDEAELVFAIQSDNISITEAFLKNRFKHNHEFKNGKKIIDVAVEKMAIKVIFFLKTEFEEFSKQQETKQKVNVINENGETLLIKCIKDSFFEDKRDLLLEYVKLFVENGVNIYAKDHNFSDFKSYVTDEDSHIETYLNNYMQSNTSQQPLND